MNDTNRGKKKQRITHNATDEGIDRANRALKRNFKSKTDFAKFSYVSRSTITKFFAQEPIQSDCFQKICEELQLSDWREIAGIKQTEKLKAREIDCPSNTNLNKGKESVQTLTRQITVIDEPNNTVLAVITLQGDINSAPNKEIFETILCEYSGKIIKVIDRHKGSIKLLIEGSPEDIKWIVFLIESNEITELSGFPVEEIEIIDENSDAEETTKSNNKWSLVKEIVSQPDKDRNLSGANLSGADLSGANLSGADLSGADLFGADLSGADLSGADLSGADLSDVNLFGAVLRNTDLSGADLRNAYLRNIDLRNANLSGANLNSAYLPGANLSGANLNSADLSDVNLNGADLRNANLIGAYLIGAYLIGAYLNSANLNSANLRNANLRNANLIGAYLNSADLSNAQLLSTNLTDADLSGAKVKKARFRDNIGISVTIQHDLKVKGAIFEDSSPGDRSKVFA
ncbi:MAG: pentapeptide repeat-containing protein [Cyanobacteria bacterium P01_G01_bin.39]